MSAATSHTSRRYILALACALAGGLLFADVFGVGVPSAGGTTPGTPGASAHVETYFSPGPGALGFVLGASLGGLAGWLLGQSGAGGVIGFGMVTAASGLAGVAVAGMAGAETRVTVIGNGVEVEHGARPGVLAFGAVLGLAVGALMAWRFGTAVRHVPAGRLAT
jgi:hypothetical protein